MESEDAEVKPKLPAGVDDDGSRKTAPKTSSDKVPTS
jgi:hypothetical protein